MNVKNNQEIVSGEHNGGFLIGLVQHAVEGKIALDLVGIKYDGNKPSVEEVTAKGREITNCATAETHGVICFLKFEEVNTTCPKSHHAGD